MFDKFENVAFWMMVPTVMVTERNKFKLVRVIGALLVLPLFFLIPLGAAIIFIGLVVDFFYEI